MNKRTIIAGTILTLGFGLLSAHAALTIDKMFSDHMVLQREMPVPVWGTADAGEEVTVTFRKQSKSVKADDQGKWVIKLDALKVGEASELSAKGASNEIKLSDVLVGEVWIGSGQSNMAGGAGGYAKRDVPLAGYIANGPYPTLRLYNKGSWAAADGKTMPGFSAIHLSFGYALHKELNIPVGLMYGAVGGTPSGRWLSTEMALADKNLVAMFTKNNGYPPSEIADKQAAKLAEHKVLAEKLKAEGKKVPRLRMIKGFGDLYAGKIEYMVPYAIRGVLWDQGESKTQIPGVDQFTTMHALITGWRTVWGQGDFHFLHIQKPSGGSPAFDPENPIHAGAATFNATLPSNHASTSATLKYPLDHIRMRTINNAPLVTAVDLGVGIHPSCKSGYGARACRVALGAVYGKDVEYYGPIYKSHKVDGDTIRIEFDHVGKGLVVKHADTILGFEIAGADGKWAWADAVINGGAIIVSSKEAASPTMVRYAFSRKASYANLYNKDGLPAQMFTSEK